MNKKVLFGIMSLAALAACTDDVLESKNVAGASEATSPVQFELINGNDAMTRASMDGNTIVWNANDGDLFTLYHGGCTGTAYQNATYKAEIGAESATLSTPSMILTGKAIMVWPVDSTFKCSGAALGLSIPAEQTNIENNIPYVSDVITIGAYDAAAPYNTAGYERKYPVYMRPMAHQLTIKADYAGTESAISDLYTGEDAIDPISVTSIELSNTANKYTTVLPLTFTAISAGDANDLRWDAAEPNNAWSDVVGFGTTATTQVAKLTAKDDCLLDGNQGCKFLILPTSVGDANSAVIVNTCYGKVVVATNGIQGSQYASGTEDADTWYRYISASTTAATGETKATTAEASGDNAGKYKTTATVQDGMTQTFTAFDAATASASNAYIAGEQVGVSATRYVKVLLNYLDMSALHITSDKQLRDAARVWQHIGHATVTVFLDGNEDGEFEMTQETIEAINEINAAAAEENTPRSFSVKPCTVTGEACTSIVVTGGGAVQDMDFIVANGATKANVVLNEGETWQWAASETAAKTLTVAPAATCGISSIINRGTFVSDATATLAIYDNAATPAQANIEFVNDGTWNVNAGDLTVQFDVTNNGTVNIKKGAEYHQDIYGTTPTATTFVNDAQTLEERFFMNDPSKTAAQKAAFVEQIGVVNNSGVFAVTGTTTVKGIINNYSLIEHADKDAKTYITSNQYTSSVYTTAFGTTNKLGRINLPYSNKDEDNISISKALTEGFVSVTVTSADAPADGKLNAAVVGDKINYVIINSGVTTITEMSAKIRYVEFNDDNDTEIAWQAGTSATPVTATYDGLIVLSPVNIKLYTTVVVNNGTYLGAKMYVGGTFTNTTGYSAYYGNTAANVTSMYITY